MSGEATLRGDKPLLQNLGILTVAQVLAQLLNMAILVYLARSLGTHWFGVLQYGVALSFYASITAEWGMFHLGVRDVARLDSPPAVLRFANPHVGLLLVMATVVLVIGLPAVTFLPMYREDPWILILFFLAVVPQVFMYDWIGIGLEQMSWVGFVKFCRSLVYAVLLFGLLGVVDGWLGWPARRWVPVLFLASYVISNQVMAWRVRRWLGGMVRPAFAGWEDWTQRLRQTAPIGASAVMARVVVGIDVIFLGVLASADVVGHYSAAARVLFVLLVAVEVLWKAFLPRLSRLWRQSREQFREKYNTYLGGVLLAFLPVAAGGLAVGDRLMVDLYGADYSEAGQVFRILSLSYVILAVGMYFSNTLIAIDRQQAMFPPLLAGAVVAIVGNLLLVPEYGALGACLAMLVSHTVFCLGTAWVCRDLLTRRLWRPLGVSLLASAIMYGVLQMVPMWHSALLIILGAAIYAVLTVVFIRRWLRSS